MILANKNNYGGKRNTADIKWIVIHYTGNDGDTAINNLKYFANNVVKSSAHYFVDSKSVEQSVPDDCIAWHCGSTTYKHPHCRNANSVGIELCDDKSDGKLCASEATINNAIELTKQLMKKYNIPADHVIRHYDVTGKRCPAYWVDDQKWKTEFWNKLTTPNDEILWAVENGIMKGNNGDLMLDQPLTRKQFCMMLKRYHDKFM